MLEIIIMYHKKGNNFIHLEAEGFFQEKVKYDLLEKQYYHPHQKSYHSLKYLTTIKGLKSL